MRTLRWALVPLVLLPLAWLFVSGFGRDPREIPSPLIGKPAPEWSLTTLDGETLSTDDLAGHPYVVNFWASWCAPCVDEHDVLSSAFEVHAEELVIVGVTYQDAPEDARNWLIRFGDPGYDSVIDADGALAIEYGVTGPPESYFVDADGIVRAKQFGPLTDALMADHLAAIGIGS